MNYSSLNSEPYIKMEVQTAEYPARFLILTLYSLCAISNAINWSTITPILSVLSDVIPTKTYDVSIIWVELSVISNVIVYIPMVLPSNHIIEVYGLRVGILLGMIFTTIGSWVRVGAYDNFWCLLVGNYVSGLGETFFYSTPSKVAEAWFRPERRTVATTIGSMSLYVGVILGYAMPAIFVGSDESKTKIGNLMLTQAIFATIVFLLCIIWFEDKPKLPPSYTASVERDPFCSSIYTCLKTFNFVSIFIAHSFAQGALLIITTLLDPITKPYGFSSTDNSIIGVVHVICGLIGSFIIGVEVTLTNKFKLSYFICSLLSLITLAGFMFTLQFESLLVTASMAGVFGLLLSPCIPISYEYGAEVIFPVDEVISVGLMNIGSQIFAIIMLAVGYILGNSSFVICSACAISLAISTVSILFSREELKRSGMDNKKAG